jgi:hypothetical protein
MISRKPPTGWGGGFVSDPLTQEGNGGYAIGNRAGKTTLAQALYMEQTYELLGKYYSAEQAAQILLGVMQWETPNPKYNYDGLED